VDENDPFGFSYFLEFSIELCKMLIFQGSQLSDIYIILLMLDQQGVFNRTWYFEHVKFVLIQSK